MLLYEAINKRIENLCNEKNITLNKLATLSCITQSTLSNLKHDEGRIPNLLTILRICTGLEITLDYFFSDPLFYNLEDE